MPVTETLGALGSWSLTLRDETPDDVRKAVNFFGRIAIADGPVDVDAAGDQLLTTARYIGVLCEGAQTLHPGGGGMLYWLGDDEKGPTVLPTAKTYTTRTLEQVVVDQLTGITTVTAGIVWPQPDAAQRYTGAHQFQSPRTVLTAVAAAFGAELRVNGDATLDVGTPAQLYGATPRAVIKRKGAGTDLDLTGLDGGFDPDNDVYDFSTGIVLLGQTQDDRTIVTATKNATGVPYLDPHGQPVKMVRLISESGETTGTVQQRAQLQLNRLYRAKRTVTLALADYESDAAARVGGYVWVYDPDSGLIDPANEVWFRGEPLRPVLERVSGATWQVRDGMTVAFRTHTGIWVDLTRWVVWETGSDELTVGDPDGNLTGPGGVQDRLDAVRGGGKVNNVPPKPPTGLTLATTSELDPTGADVSRITATWTAPVQNLDDTLLTDLAYFTVNYKRPADAQWQAVTTEDTSVALPVAPGLDYQVRVRVVDSDGQTSAWSGIATIRSANDAVPPPTPSDPVVSSYLGQLRIEWDGLASGGQPMPADLNRVDVHVGNAAGFTPTPTTKVDEFTSGTRAVTYATAPYGVPRWVRLQAYDHQGNASGLSGSVAGTTAQVVSADVFDGAIGTAKLANLAVVTAKIADLAVNNAKIASLDVGKLTAGTFTADIINAGRLRSATSGNRYELDGAGLRWYRGTALMADWRGADGTLRIYNTTDASHTSTGHGIQFGDTAGQNLIVDDNEVMSRFNGGFGTLLLNREGGQVLIGGRVGGFPTPADTGVFPKGTNYSVVVRASLQVYNVSSGDYDDEYPPFLVGAPGDTHIWMDGDSIGSSDTGDAPGNLYLNPPFRQGGVEHHVEPVVLGSSSLAIRRWGTYSAGTRSALIYAVDASNDVGIRLTDDTVGSGGDRVSITNSDGTALRPLEASNVALPSSESVKTNIRPIVDALSKVVASPASLYEYIDAVEPGDTTHVGPMLDALPTEVVLRPENPAAAEPMDRTGLVSLPSLVGLHHEAIREVGNLARAGRDRLTDHETRLVKLEQALLRINLPGGLL